MTATEERARLMAAATRIQQELTLIREQLRPFSQYVADLIAGGDSLMLQAALEKDKGEVPKVTKGLEQMGIPKLLPFSANMPPFSADIPIPKPVLKAGKRACSLCRQPGHRAQNCPNAHVIRERDKAQKEAPKPKRTRKPVSEERKAQLRETLKKARAARKK